MKPFDPTPAWMHDAGCAGMDPDLFHPQLGENDTTDEARAVCETCPVMHQCRWWALEHRERFGMWGGLSERQRRRIRRSPGQMDRERTLAVYEAARAGAVTS